MPDNILTSLQVEQFLNLGYVKIENCFDRSSVQDWIDLAFSRLGYTADDPLTWAEAKVHLPSMNKVEVPDFAPKAWQAICELMGGARRIKKPVYWGDSFIINFRLGANQKWQPPSPKVSGWHKDGDWFRHFLDSPEQGLLTIVLWDDVQPESGGTYIATDSIGPVAKYLLQYPQGITPQKAEFSQLIKQCQKFEEVTGRAGDVFLLHPYILHSASQNPSGRPRIITNPAVSFQQPMDFNRPDPSDYSLVERSVLHNLKVDHLNFKITRARERITPERVHRQRKMMETQINRLAANHIN